MHLSIHVPMFGSASVEAKPVECPVCQKGREHGVNDWVEANIETCEPGDTFTCARCGKSVIINWGLVEPDHLSNWKNSEHCPHRVCKLKRDLLRGNP